MVAADKNLATAQQTADRVLQEGGQALALEVDVSLSDSVEKMVKATVDGFGRLDVLVSNAGYGFAATVLETEESDWYQLTDVNLKGVYLGCKFAIPVMRRQGGGVIVNTASAAALVGVRERAAYCASKGGVAAMTRAMALDHAADGVRINSIAPGSVDSPYYNWIFADSKDPVSLRKEIEERHLLKRSPLPTRSPTGCCTCTGRVNIDSLVKSLYRSN